MTSNLGSATFQDASIPIDKRREAIVEDVRGFFRPEFVNRIDEIVVFDPLGPKQIREIVDIQIGLLDRRLADRSLTLELTDAARDLLARKGYDPAFGARPLKRLIQRDVQDPLAMRLLAGEIREGDSVVVDAEGDALTFRTTQADAGQPAAAAP
jgi:ATP-dependent Clp protease ATP-binding subunit ClpB